MTTIHSQTRRVLALFPLILVLIGCAEASPSRLAQELPAPARSPVAPGNDPTNAQAIPVSGSAQSGVLYRYELYVHCGIDYWLSWDFDGSFWDVASPPASDPQARDMEVVGQDHGTIELVSPDTARYTASNGLVIELTRSPDTERHGVMCA